VPARKPPPVSIRPARPGETSADADLTHSRATDPEGALVAVDTQGRVLGSATAALREDTLLFLALDVDADQRGHGIGSALLAAARAYGEARGARALEALVPLDPPTLSFFLRAGLCVRALVLGMTAPALARASASAASLHTVEPGAPLSGWIAALDREIRGFARPRDWARWASEGHVVSLKRGGRAVALGAWSARPSGTVLGPIAARTPEAAAELLGLLAPLAQGDHLTLALPTEARALLLAAARLGFRAVSTRVLLTDGQRGDLRRYAGAGGRFF
jgi:predicted GNAT family acetyltransferase